MVIVKQHTRLHPLLQANRTQIVEVCKEYFVSVLYTFGSINTPKFHKNSDIDFLVSFDMTQFPIEDYADIYFGLEYRLKEILGRDIDLVTARSIKNPYFKAEVLRTSVQLYPKLKANG